MGFKLESNMFKLIFSEDYYDCIKENRLEERSGWYI